MRRSKGGSGPLSGFGVSAHAHGLICVGPTFLMLETKRAKFSLYKIV